jgi:hypothetical protein
MSILLLMLSPYKVNHQGMVAETRPIIRFFALSVKATLQT